jgi:hypothetical protein
MGKIRDELIEKRDKINEKDLKIKDNVSENVAEAEEAKDSIHEEVSETKKVAQQYKQE